MQFIWLIIFIIHQSALNTSNVPTNDHDHSQILFNQLMTQFCVYLKLK